MSHSEETWTALQMAAIGMHELFKTLVSSGFTEDQALKLIGVMVNTVNTECDGNN